MNQNWTSDFVESIAIVGMAGSFPNSPDVEAFWENLKTGRDCVTFYSKEELLQAGVDEELLSHPNYVRARGALPDIDLFDASFFDISRREAELMDPQHRLLLECAWHALEHAGYHPETHAKLVGIYAGESMSSYAYLNVLPHIRLLLSANSLQAAIGNDKDSLTTMVSYHLNLRGPAITIQTSSSTSLVAVSVACQQLLSYQCDMALAGGVSCGPPLKSGYLYEEGGISSMDGKCRPFDQNSTGFVPGSGVGLVVLKRLQEAVQDRDTIWAVIKGCAINNDGKHKVSYSAPSVEAQAEVVMSAQEYADFSPETIGYIEAHGTATKLGDPIEIAALTEAFRRKTAKKNFCAIGSVKSNIGHLDTAAGIAGLIKTALCLKYRTLVPSIHFDTPNPALHLEDSPFYVSAQIADWKSSAGPLRAGVTSLGMGGTNAHVVLEEAPKLERTEIIAPEECLITFSAKTASALQQIVLEMCDFLRASPPLSLADFAYTLNVGRKNMKVRKGIVASSFKEVLEQLDSLLRFPFKEWSDFKVLFRFDNSNSNHLELTRGLFRHYGKYRSIVCECLALLPAGDREAIERLLSSGVERLESSVWESCSSNITPLFSFIFQYALGSLLLEWGIVPHGQMGLGVGEYVAAAIGGVMSVRSALGLVLSSELESIPPVELSAPHIPILSDVTGEMITEQVLSSAYWAIPRVGCVSQQEMRSPSLPGPVWLLNIRSDGVECRKILDGGLLESFGKDESTFKDLLNVLNTLYEGGADIAWAHFYEDQRLHRIPLPTYPFEKRRFWLNPPPLKRDRVPREEDQGRLYNPRPSLIESYEAPHSAEEKGIVKIWEDALGIQPIGVNDNFFNLGGASLEATIVLTSINDQFAGKITLSQFYNKPTVEEIARLVKGTAPPDFGSILEEIVSLTE